MAGAGRDPPVGRRPSVIPRPGRTHRGVLVAVAGGALRRGDADLDPKSGSGAARDAARRTPPAPRRPLAPCPQRARAHPDLVGGHRRRGGVRGRVARRVRRGCVRDRTGGPARFGRRASVRQPAHTNRRPEAYRAERLDPHGARCADAPDARRPRSGRRRRGRPRRTAGSTLAVHGCSASGGPESRSGAASDRTAAGHGRGRGTPPRRVADARRGPAARGHRADPVRKGAR